MINDLIRLKQTPAAPINRWQTVCTLRPAASGTTVPSSPLKQLCTNIQAPKTPDAQRCRLVMKTPSKSNKATPGLHKTPKSSHTTPKMGVQTPSSRFIPNRATTDIQYSNFLLTRKEKEGDENEEDKEGGSPGREEYKHTLNSFISRSRGHQQKGVLSFKHTTPAAASTSFLDYTGNESEMGGASFCGSTKSTKSTYHFPSVPEKILDLPSLSNDYYLNNLDWGRNNLVAIGLGDGVYLWNASDGTSTQLMELPAEHYVTSVAWSRNSKYLAVGDSSACIQLWDVAKEKRIRTMKGHSDRVGALAWNKHTVTSASRDGMILHNDVRKPEHVVGQSSYHKMEVCGMQWSPDGSKMASGGNDNMVCIWNAKDLSKPEHILQGHSAAVKAVAWCPWQPNVLATGGGTNDRTIRFWNTFTGQCSETVDTKSQVSSLNWNKDHKQLLSAHGHPRNHMVIWQYPNMAKLGCLTGHSERILHMCLSPGRSRAASASSDETLRIWKCFEKLQLDTSHRSCSEISALLHSFN